MECVEKDASAAAKFTCAPVHGHRKLCDCAFQPTIFLHLDILTVSHRFHTHISDSIDRSHIYAPKDESNKVGYVEAFSSSCPTERDPCPLLQAHGTRSPAHHNTF